MKRIAELKGTEFLWYRDKIILNNSPIYMSVVDLEYNEIYRDSGRFYAESIFNDFLIYTESETKLTSIVNLKNLNKQVSDEWIACRCQKQIGNEKYLRVKDKADNFFFINQNLERVSPNTTGTGLLLNIIDNIAIYDVAGRSLLAQNVLTGETLWEIKHNRDVESFKNLGDDALYTGRFVTYKNGIYYITFYSIEKNCSSTLTIDLETGKILADRRDIGNIQHYGDSFIYKIAINPSKGRWDNYVEILDYEYNLIEQFSMIDFFNDSGSPVDWEFIKLEGDFIYFAHTFIRITGCYNYRTQQMVWQDDIKGKEYKKLGVRTHKIFTDETRVYFKPAGDTFFVYNKPKSEN